MSNENFTNNENTESAQVAAPAEQQISLVQSVYSDSQAFSNLTKSERDTNTDKNNGKDGYLEFPSLYPGEGSKNGSQFPKPSEDPGKVSKPAKDGGLEQGAKEKPPGMPGIPGRPETQKPEDGGKFGKGGMEMPHKETKPTDGAEKKPENNDKGQQQQKELPLIGNKLENLDKKGPYENNYPNGEIAPSGSKFEPQEKKAPENNGPFGGLNPAEGKWGKQPGPSDGPVGKPNREPVHTGDKTGSDSGKGRDQQGKLNPREEKLGGGRGPTDRPPSPNDAPTKRPETAPTKRPENVQRQINTIQKSFYINE